ncbi:MAG: hypothetical protein ACREMV_05410 [Gemmatimonadales bacterium]
MNRAHRLLALLLLGIFALAPTGVAAQAPDTIQGMVRRVDAPATTFDVVTGVSTALRVVLFRAGTAAYISADGAPLRLADLRPGDIVRVQYRATPQGNVCDKVERVGRLETGPGGAP